MNRKKVFFITFFTTFAIMLGAFGVLYMSLDVQPRETDKTQSNVPIAKPSLDDSKTILACIGSDDNRFFFLVKFNAIQNKISVMTISSSYPMAKAGRTLNESIEKAGIFQCSYDLVNEFDINIDYYMQCDFDVIANVLKDFTDLGVGSLSEDLPAGVRAVILKGAEKIDMESLINIIKTTAGVLDSDVGLAFLNETAYNLIKHNMETMNTTTAQNFKKSFDKMTTSINAVAITKLSRIIDFLLLNEITFERDIIIKQEENAQARIDKLFKE